MKIAHETTINGIAVARMRTDDIVAAMTDDKIEHPEDIAIACLYDENESNIIFKVLWYDRTVEDSYHISFFTIHKLSGFAKFADMPIIADLDSDHAMAEFRKLVKP